MIMAKCFLRSVTTLRNTLNIIKSSLDPFRSSGGRKESSLCLGHRDEKTSILLELMSGPKRRNAVSSVAQEG